ncbi:MAG: isoprenyl transferase [Bryobacterales bacterium]|nr:isoprenyl transferase [Bryobacterales bacterium]MBV9400485.1 isoprenyl transferase [Bryobacterales bacterium]
MQSLLDLLAPGDEDYAIARAIDPARLPAHIAIIMDGNGRWARHRHLPRVAGHRAGVQAVRSTVESCAQLGIRALTLYAFSMENWKRPRTEVDTLWGLLRLYLNAELPLMMKHGIRFNAIGRLDALPAAVREDLDAVIRRTANNRGLLLNIAINYGGRAEIVDAVKALVEEARSGTGPRVDEAAISARLYTAGIPDPDLLVRTSGEMRVSNFLLWQIAYAELYVTETLWPDFTRTELLEAILDYQRRERRFGGLHPAPAEHVPIERPAAQAASIPVR